MTRTRLGFCSLSALDRPLAQVAELCAGLGLDGLEVSARPPHLDPDDDPEAARAAGRAVRDAGLSVLAYGSYLGRFERMRPEHAEPEARRAAAMGAERLRVWAEPEPGADPGDDFRRVVTLLQEACDAAAPEGVEVVVERHLGSYADTPERIATLLEAVDRERFSLNYQVLDALPGSLAAAQPGDAAALAPRSRYLHLKNYRPGEDPDAPLLPGASLADGVLDYTAILAAAFEAGYDGPLAIEFLSFEPVPVEEKLERDLRWLRGVLRELGAAQ